MSKPRNIPNAVVFAALTLIGLGIIVLVLVFMGCSAKPAPTPQPGLVIRSTPGAPDATVTGEAAKTQRGPQP